MQSAMTRAPTRCDAGGGFGVDVHHDLRRLAVDEFGGFGVGEGFAPGLLEAHDLGTVAPGHVGHAVAEVSVGEDHDFGAGFDQVGDGSFHASAAGGRDNEGALVLGAEDVAQHALVVATDLEKVRIEVSDDGLGHGLIHAGVHLRGAGAEQ